jgi:hypothetical protein
MELPVESSLLSFRYYRPSLRPAPVEGTPLSDSKADWLEYVADRCRQFTELTPNWDTYGAPPVSPFTVQAAMTILGRLATASLPPPRVVPTAQGGLQFEWRIQERALEVQFNAPTQVSLFFSDESTGEETEVDLRSDLKPFSDVLKKLAPSP